MVEAQEALSDVEHLRDLWEKALTAAVAKNKELESSAQQEYNGANEIQYSKKAQRGRSIEQATMENNRFDRLRQFGDNLPAEWYAFTSDYFYIYSNQSFMDYTVLVKARITANNRSDIKRFTEELENGTYEYSETFNSWTSAFRRGKGSYHWDSIRTGKRGTAVQSDGMDVRERRGKHSKNSEENSGNREQKVTRDYEQVALEMRALESIRNSLESYSSERKEINRQIRKLRKEFYSLYPHSKEAYNKNGETVAQIHENGSAQFSLKTYKEGGRDYLTSWLDGRVKSKQIDKSDAADIVKQLDEYYRICKRFEGKYAPFGAWSRAEVVTDSKGNPVFSVVKKNGEYAMNLDFSLVCKKRRTLDAVFSEMINGVFIGLLLVYLVLLIRFTKRYKEAQNRE